MKKFKFSLLALLFLFLSACSSDDNGNDTISSPIIGEWKLIKVRIGSVPYYYDEDECSYNITFHTNGNWEGIIYYPDCTINFQESGTYSLTDDVLTLEENSELSQYDYSFDQGNLETSYTNGNNDLTTNIYTKVE